MPRLRSRQLKILLLKNDIATFEEALKEDPSSLNVYGLRAALPFDGIAYVQNPRFKPASWRDFLQAGAEATIIDVITGTAAAVLFVAAGGRKFALTFGYGRNLLHGDCFERDFGLKVVLNTVDPNSVRSLDIKTFEELTLATRRQASRASSLGTFGLDVNRDLLRAVTGTPRDESFAKQIAGSDALTISLPIEFHELGEKCEALLVAYQSDDYKESFGFIDQVRSIRDTLLIGRLQERLLADLANGRTETMHLAPPEPIDWENISGFTYSSRRAAEVFADLDIDDMLEQIGAPDEATVDLLKKKHIGVRYRESERSIDKWSIYSCIVYEVNIDNRLYVLSGGDWFEINPGFAQHVKDSVAQLPASSLELPPANPNEYEGQYNERVARDHGFALMDKQLIQYPGPYDKIELCDLLTPDRKFVHVKRKTSSATLSHLFAQGAISAEMFLWEIEFRARSRAKVETVESSFVSLIPDAKPDPGEYEVVYAVIAKPNPAWPRSLPFFSQLNLKNTVERLRRFGFQVSLQLIEQR